MLEKYMELASAENIQDNSLKREKLCKSITSIDQQVDGFIDKVQKKVMTADKGELMQRFRKNLVSSQSLSEDEKNILFNTTLAFEKIVWLISSFIRQE